MHAQTLTRACSVYTLDGVHFPEVALKVVPILIPLDSALVPALPQPHVES